MTLHERVERGFEAWGGFVFRWRWPALLLSLLVTVGALSLMPGIRYDNSAESLLLQNDPALERYERFRNEFGQDQFMLIAAEGSDIFELPFLERLAALHDDLEDEVPYLEEVTSLINARDTRAEGDALDVGELLDSWPETPEDLAQLRERVFANSWYPGSLINESGTLTGVLLEPQMYSSAGHQGDVLEGFDDAGAEPGAEPEAEPEPLSYEENTEQIAAIQAVMERHSSPDFRLRLSGAEPVSQHLNVILNREAGFSIGGSLLVNLVLLGLVFRRLSSVMLPAVVVLSAVFAAFGTMVLLDIPMSVTNSILPRFLVVVGICNTVHLLTGVYQRSARETDKRQVLEGALGRSGLPVAMASLTTAGGVLAFTATDLAQTVNLGISASIGVVLALVYSLVMLPACVALTPLSRKGAFGGRRFEATVGAALARVGGAATARPGLVLLAAAVIVAIGATGLPRLRFAQHTLHWFPESDPMRLTTELLDRELAGVLSLEVLIDSGRENGLYEPELLERIDRSVVYAESLDWVGKATSLIDVVKETHQALNGDDPGHYEIPGDEDLVAQELLLFENGGAEQLRNFVDPSFRIARMTVRQPYSDGMVYEPRIEELSVGLRRELGSGVPFEVTGVTSLFGRTFRLVNLGMAQSYVLALLIITPLMVFMIGSLRLGLIAMVPNLTPILLMLGVMGWLDLPLDNSTLLLGCVIIGLAVDDTIHFMHAFRRYSSQGLDVEQAVQRTLATTGAALLTTTLVLTLGFLVGTAAYLENIVRFGALAAFATVTAFVTDIFLAPALVSIFARRPQAQVAAAAG